MITRGKISPSAKYLWVKRLLFAFIDKQIWGTLSPDALPAEKKQRRCPHYFFFCNSQWLYDVVTKKKRLIFNTLCRTGHRQHRYTIVSRSIPGYQLISIIIINTYVSWHYTYTYAYINIIKLMYIYISMHDDICMMIYPS